MPHYQPLPESGKVALGFYMSRYGRVWVTKSEPEWIYDTATTGHYEDRFQTQLEGVAGCFNGLVSVEQITRAFEERDQEWRAQDQARW